MSTEVKKLLTELEDAEKIANTDLADVHPNVHAAWGARISQAKADVERLSAMYRRAAMEGGLAMFVSGDAAKCAEFAAIAAEEYETVVVDAAELYRRMAMSIEPLLAAGGRQMMPQHVALVIDRLRDVAEEYDMEIHPQVESLPIVADVDATTDYIRDLVRKCAGDSLNIASLSRQVAKGARDSRYMGGTLPVVVVGATEAEVPGIGSVFGRVGATLTLREDSKVDKNTVLQHFNAVKNKLKREKNTSN